MVVRNKYAEDFVFMTLEPFIRDLEVGRKDIIEVPLVNLFRQVECWRYNYSEEPRHDQLFGYCPGMPEVETKEVYDVLDAAFQRVFPDLIGYSREEAAKVLEDMVRSVYQEMLENAPPVPSHKEQLTAFVKEIIQALKSLNQSGEILAVSESAT